MPTRKKTPRRIRRFREETVQMPIQVLQGEFLTDASAAGGSSVDLEARTVQLRWYGGTPVVRYDYRTGEEYMLQLSLNPRHVRMGRLESGAPLLNTHSSYSLEDVIGVIEQASVSQKTGGLATVRFSDRPTVEPIFNDVANRILRNVSVGVRIFKLKDITEDPENASMKTYLAIDYEPHEISLVPIGADATAQVLSSQEPAQGMVPCVIQSRRALHRSATHAGGKNMRGRLRKLIREAIDANLSDQHSMEQVLQSLREASGDDSNEIIERVLGGDLEAANDERLTAWAAELEVVTLDELQEARRADLADEPVAEERRPSPAPERTRPAPALPEPARAPTGAELQEQMAEVARRVRREERQRASQIRADATLAGLPAEFAESLISNEELDVNDARTRILERRALLDRESHTESLLGVGVDESDKIRPAMESALLFRYNSSKYELTDAAREFTGMTLFEMSRWAAERAGHRTTGKPRIEVARLALGTSSDFPKILAAVANKTLRDAYDESPRTWRPLARQVTAADFKTIHRVQLGEAPTLEKVNEHGEFRRGKISDGEETYAVETYGKVIGITRKVIINDDLNAFTRIPMLFGMAAARLESDIMWALITANPTMGDGVALFNAGHSNLGTAAAISNASLDAGYSAVAKQKGVDGQAHLNLLAKHLVVPVSKRATALAFVGTYALQRMVATKGSDINVFASDLDVISEPRLDDDSTLSWYLACDPAQVDVLEYAYLEGQQGVAVETREGFDVDGVEVKARLDFGGGVIDYRGLYKNPGA